MKEQMSFLTDEQINLAYTLTPERHRRALRGMVLAHLGRGFGTFGRTRCICGRKGIIAATMTTWQFACPHCDHTLSGKISTVVS